MEPPRIVLTMNNPERAANPADAAAKRQRYLEAVMRAGGRPLPLDERSSSTDLERAWAGMDGLLITGGGDIDPVRYGEAAHGSDPPDVARDALDEEAYRQARERRVPVLGICRGLQAINVFEGGTLVQHLEGHESEGYPSTAVTRHPIAIRPDTWLARTVGGTSRLEVNSYHHQAVSADRVAAGLRVSATADHPEHGELAEAFESADPARWLVGIQCHPERTESSPAELEAVWTAFVAASRERAERAERPEP